MSEIKSTPGPWQIDPDWGPCEKHPEWASINIGPDYISVSGHIGAANARLIAAAPDLLDACRQFSRALESEDEYELGNAYQSVGLAIAKATGEES